MLASSLTYQLAQMALENQYDRCAVYCEIPNELANDPSEAAITQEIASLLSLDETSLQDAVPEVPADPAYELQQAKSLYTFHLLIARLVFRNDTHAHETLLLSGKRHEDVAGWAAQAVHFYADLGYLSSAMINYGITLPELRQAKVMIEAVADEYM